MTDAGGLLEFNVTSDLVYPLGQKMTHTINVQEFCQGTLGMTVFNWFLIVLGLNIFVFMFWKNIKEKKFIIKGFKVDVLFWLFGLNVFLIGMATILAFNIL